MNKTLSLYVMTQKGYGVLKALHAAYPEIIETVVSSRDQKIQIDYFDEIEQFCTENNISFYDRQTAPAVTTNTVITISWRWLINPPPSFLIVFHDSLLPKYRGFNPLVSSLINGDTEIGVTALFATEEYDRGKIIAQSSSSIAYPIKIQAAFDLILENYISLAMQVANKVVSGEVIEGISQFETEASYSLWRDEDDYIIDWSLSADDIKRFIDSVGYPYKGAKAFIKDQSVRIIDAEVVEDVLIVNRSPGKVIFMRNGRPVIVCGVGLLLITEVIDEQSGRTILPLSQFRTRFKMTD